MENNQLPPPSGTSTRNTKETFYYEVLGLQANATADEIKRAYRRQALLFHPDKNPNGAEQFKQINIAWEILGDEKMKAVYDRYGQMGVDMTKQLGEGAAFFMSSEAESMALTFFCLSSIFLAITSLFPIFVALKADGNLSWSWPVVWTPLWLLDALVFVFLIGRYFLNSKSSQEEEPDEQFEASLDDLLNPDGSPLSQEDRDRLRSRHRQQVKTMDNLLGIKRTVHWTLFVLFQVFLAIRLNETVDWAWTTVFIPWWIGEGITLVELAFQYILVLSVSKSTMDPESPWKGRAQNIRLFFLTFQFWIMRVLLSIAITLRADSHYQSNWSLAFLPLFIFFSIQLLRPFIQYSVYGRHLTGEQRSAFLTMSAVKVVGLVVGGLLFFIMLGLFISRLNGNSSISVATIMIPVFIVLALLFCCSCCCLPCMILAGRIGDADPEASVTPLPLTTKRIAYGSTHDA